MAQDTLMNIMEDELKREVEGFSHEEYPPYYIDYQVNDEYSVSIHSSFGSLTDSKEDKIRSFGTTVRVGSYDLDNTHEFKGNTNYNPGNTGYRLIPVENQAEPIKQLVWITTDMAYKNALSSFMQIKEKLNEDKEKEIEKVADFSRENPVVYIEKPMTAAEHINIKEWNEKIKLFSRPFLEDTSIVSGEAVFSYITERKYFLSNEGSRIVQNRTYAFLQIFGTIKAEDGNPLPMFKSYFAIQPSGIPGEQVILKDVAEMIGTLKKLKKSQKAEPFTGPVIFSSQAAGVFFHEIFGHRIEGQRLKNESDGQTFLNRINTKVLPKYLSVVSDPTLNSLNGHDLIGSYKYDDQGVKGEKVTVVENGTLKNFLMSRTPIKGFPRSFGHGRSQTGLQPVSRQSNLIVENTKPIDEKEMRKKLIKECKKQHKPYGYYVKEVMGGFTYTSRYVPNVFNIIPLEVYRIYEDGKPDELVRGVDFIGTPLAMFSEIEAAGDKEAIFTGFCSAESGSVPVTAISPAIYVRKLETQRKAETFIDQPVLPAPETEKPSSSRVDSVIIRAMRDEMDRNIRDLENKEKLKPFFISYTIADMDNLYVIGTLGSIISSDTQKGKTWMLRVLMGDYNITDENFENKSNLGDDHGKISYDLPIDNDYFGIRRSLWTSTNNVFELAAENYKNKIDAFKKNSLSVEPKPIPDFCKVPVINLSIPPNQSGIDQSKAENLVKTLSAGFKNFPDIYRSGVSYTQFHATVYFMNTEGTQTVFPLDIISIMVNASALAKDEDNISNQLCYYAKSADDLPKLEKIQKDIHEMIENIQKLKQTDAYNDSYTGPVLISDQAVAEIYAQCLFGSKSSLNAYREPIYNNSQNMSYSGNKAFENKMDKRIISKDITIKAEDQLKEYDGFKLLGNYAVDAEGVIPSNEITLIENGVLKNLFNGRTPTPKISESNGHNRYVVRGNGISEKTGSGILEINSSNSKSNEQLKKQLIEIAKDKGLDYAIIIRSSVPGDFFSSVDIYKVSLIDGKEELIRSAKIKELSLNLLNKIILSSDKKMVWNAIQSGSFNQPSYSEGSIVSGLAVSYIFPEAMLLDEMEIISTGASNTGKKPIVKNPLE